MKTKQLAIMVAVAAVLGGAAFFLNRKDNTGMPTGDGTAGSKVIDLPVNEVESMIVQSATGKASLVKKDEIWTVEDRTGYPANFERISDLLRKLWDLKTVQVQNVGASQFARLELAEPLVGAGTKVEFKGKDGKALGTLILGKKHMKESAGGPFGGGDGGFPAGRYVMQPGAKHVSLISETLDEFEAKPESWLSRDFFKIENPSSVTVAGATDAQKWKITRENATAEWKLDGAKPEEKVDAGKVSPVNTAFSNPTFSDVLAPDAKPADTGLDKPTVITIETFDGFTYVLKVGKETSGNQPVTVEVSGKFAKERTAGKDEKPEDKTKLDEEFQKKLKGFEEKLAAEKKYEGRPFLIAKSTLDQVVKDRSALLAEKPATPPPTTPPAGTPQAGSPVPGTPTPGATAPATNPPTVTSPPVSVPPANKPTGGAAKPPQKPVTATTPPVSVPPAKPDRKPVTATTPPVTVPPITKPGDAKPVTPKNEATKPDAAKPEPPKPSTPPAAAPKPETPATPPAKPDASKSPPPAN